jgi:hypothetical protein
VINDLDSTLQELLERELHFTSPVTISFDTPDDEFSPTLPAVDLFLYDVRENRELRNNDWQVERQNDGTVVKTRPPVRVECSYLITAWAGDIENEHLLLGEVMRVLLRHPTVPAEVLQGTLVGQEPPLPAISIQQGRLQSMAEFWQALGGTPKAALNYTVTISVPTVEPVGLPGVEEKIIHIKQGVEREEGE